MAGTSGIAASPRPPLADSPWFKLTSWRRLLDALDLTEFDPASAMLRTNVGWILAGGWRGQRVHRLAVVIIDSFETVFGDVKVQLADPTGVIRCTVRAHSHSLERRSRTFRPFDALVRLARARSSEKQNTETFWPHRMGGP